jgi:hypothetical protein
MIFKTDEILETDLPIMEDHRLQLQTLMVTHWKRFSDTELCFPKFHNTDHVVMDIDGHGTAHRTSTGPGESEHQAVKRLFSHHSNRTMNSTSLSRQLLEGQRLFDFLHHTEEEEWCGEGDEEVEEDEDDGVRLVGAGNVDSLNGVIFKDVERLHKADWDDEMCVAPIKLAQGLFTWARIKYKLDDRSLNDFSSRRVRVFNSVNISGVGTIYASLKFHGAERHDFVSINGRDEVYRVVRLLELFILERESIELAALEVLNEERNVKELACLESRVFSETNDWVWVKLSKITAVHVMVPNTRDNRYHTLFRDKHELKVWK